MSATRDADHPLWEQGEMANAHLWAERVVPNSGFAVERFGTHRPEGDSVASVRPVLCMAPVRAPRGLRRLGHGACLTSKTKIAIVTNLGRLA